MVILDNTKGKLELVKHGNGTFTINRSGEYRTLALKLSHLQPIYDKAKSGQFGDMEAFIENLVNGEGISDTPLSISEILKYAMDNLLSFFTEFNFTPSFRFVNTLCRKAVVKTDEARNYVLNYFKLIDSPYANEVIEKTKSKEFTSILKAIGDNAKPTKEINSRLKIYYGSQGTGKTTQASTETDYTVVCNSSMQPCDLIEDFTFDDGKATFHPSALVKCMEQGKPIMLDEINLLPYDCLRFLQGICDGKESFEWKGNTIHIANGFTIIGTMNLTVNGVTFGLPEPLIDRCSDMKEFTLTGEALLNAI